MVVLLTQEILRLVTHLVLLIDNWLGGPTSQRINDWIAGDIATQIIWLAFVVFDAVSIFMIGQLLWFHIGLRRQGLTTYRYIVQDHKEKRELAKRTEDLEAQRITALRKAREDGNTLRVWQLQYGRCCRNVVGCGDVCDPIKLPPPAPEPDPEKGFAASLGGQEVAQGDQPDPLSPKETMEEKVEEAASHEEKVEQRFL